MIGETELGLLNTKTIPSEHSAQFFYKFITPKNYLFLKNKVAQIYKQCTEWILYSNVSKLFVYRN